MFRLVLCGENLVSPKENKLCDPSLPNFKNHNYNNSIFNNVLSLIMNKIEAPSPYSPEHPQISFVVASGNFFNVVMYPRGL